MLELKDVSGMELVTLWNMERDENGELLSEHGLRIFPQALGFCDITSISEEEQSDIEGKVCNWFGPRIEELIDEFIATQHKISH